MMHSPQQLKCQHENAYVHICQGLGQMLTQVGIKTNVNAISKTVYFPAYSRQEYSMFMNGWGTLTGEASYTLGGLAHSNNPDLKLGAYNRLEYKNDDVDRLLQTGAKMMDEDKRRATYEEAMEICREYQRISLDLTPIA